MYANIPNLMSALRQTGNESDDGVYFGRWPRDRVHDRVKKGMPVNFGSMSNYIFNSWQMHSDG